MRRYNHHLQIKGSGPSYAKMNGTKGVHVVTKSGKLGPDSGDLVLTKEVRRPSQGCSCRINIWRAPLRQARGHRTAPAPVIVFLLPPSGYTL